MSNWLKYLLVLLTPKWMGKTINEDVTRVAKNISNSGKPSCSAVVVLGMHRSGTSALSRLLIQLGADGPANLLPRTGDNPHGYFEPRDLSVIHDEILASAGTNWYDYCPFPEGWLTSPKVGEFQSRVKTLLDTEFGTSGFFLVKDPRICRLVPFWRQVLEDVKAKPLFVHTHRNPIEVAQSLHKRDGFDLEYGYLLWLRHILDAEAGSRNHLRSFTSYDRLIMGWSTEIEKIASDLDISWPKYSGSQLSELGSMIQPDLKHNVSDGLIESKVFSSWFRDTFDVFNRWAKSGEDPTDHAMLDQIRQEFDKSSVAFAGTTDARAPMQAKQRQAAIKKLTSERDASLARLDQQQAAIEGLTSDCTSLTGQLNTGDSMLRQRNAELDDTLQKLHAMSEALTEEKDRNVALKEDISSALEQITKLQKVTLRQDKEMVLTQKAIVEYQIQLDAAQILTRQRQADVEKITTERDAANAQAIKITTERDAANARAIKTAQLFMDSNSWRITAPLRWIAMRFR